MDGPQAPKLTDQSDPNQYYLTTGLTYNQGPVSAAFTYDQARLPDVSNANNYKYARGWDLSGSYDFSVLSVALAFGQDYNSKLGIDEYYRNDFKYNNYSIAVAVPVGQGRVTGNFAISKPHKAAKAAGEKTLQAYSLAYSRPVTKRTNVYALGAYTQNYLQKHKDTDTLVTVGVRHHF